MTGTWWARDGVSCTGYSTSKQRLDTHSLSHLGGFDKFRGRGGGDGVELRGERGGGVGGFDVGHLGTRDLPLLSSSSQSAHKHDTREVAFHRKSPVSTLSKTNV